VLNSKQLKIIAVVTMFFDHLADRCFYGWGIGGIEIPGIGMNLYILVRAIGRIAFLIYAFEISEGVRYTHSALRYAGRLALLAAVSEIPFDFALHGLRLLPSQRTAGWTFAGSIDWRYQNVFFTLLLGMLAVWLMKGMRDAIGRLFDSGRGGQAPGKSGGARFSLSNRKGKAVFVLLTAGRFAVWAGAVLVLSWTAEYILRCDYGAGGVALIAVCGLCNERWEEIFPLYLLPVIRIVICGLGLAALIVINHNTFERYAAIALIFIGMYSGKKGYTSKKLQQAFYWFYPVHLMFIGFLAAATGV
jgi:hypothetical protein